MDDAFEVPADWYDGTNALRHSGVLRWDGRGGLSLQASSSRVDLNAADLRFGETRTDRTLYRSESVPDFRLFLPNDLPPGLASQLPGKSEYGAWVDKLGLGKAAAIFTVVSVAAVAAVAF